MFDVTYHEDIHTCGIIFGYLNFLLKIPSILLMPHISTLILSVLSEIGTNFSILSLESHGKVSLMGFDVGFLSIAMSVYVSVPVPLLFLLYFMTGTRLESLSSPNLIRSVL